MISDRARLQELRVERRKHFNGVCPTYRINTWVPEKYLLIDAETGDRWEFVLQPSGQITTRRAQRDDLDHTI